MIVFSDICPLEMKHFYVREQLNGINSAAPNTEHYMQYYLYILL